MLKGLFSVGTGGKKHRLGRAPRLKKRKKSGRIPKNALTPYGAAEADGGGAEEQGIWTI